MEELMLSYLTTLPTIALVVLVAVMLFVLGKGANILVEEAVSLSLHWGVSKTIIGATIVSLGTTLPEVSVSVLAAINGNSDLALGNAIGSIIVNASLIIGLAAMIGSLTIDPMIIKRQGKIQIAAGILLAFVSLPFLSKDCIGNISQFVGLVFLGLLVLYTYASIRWARQSGNETQGLQEEKSCLFSQIFKLLLGIALVIISSKILIPAVEITAIRVGIPQSIIAATLIAFGTSLPELVTVLAAVRKGHGELAIGNVLGANILNVLFVVGGAAAVTKEGLNVPLNFYRLQIPVMLLVLGMFRLFSRKKKNAISKKEGLVLVLIYAVYLILNYI